MSREIKAKVRDRRQPGWFPIDNEVIEVYGPEIGCHGIAVYAALAKYADRDTEECHPGLRRLCKELKIGRKKLLDTLAHLEQIGLIDIEPGDRVTVNVYTLLNVPKKLKGGSNENHPTPTGGSNENQGGSETHVLGGSNENHNKTHTEQDLINKREVATLTHLKRWTKSKEDTDALLTELKEKYPGADTVETLDSFTYAVKHGSKQMKDLPLTLRTYFRKSHEWSSEDNTPPKQAPDASQFRGGNEHASMDEERKQRIRRQMGMTA